MTMQRTRAIYLRDRLHFLAVKSSSVLLALSLGVALFAPPALAQPKPLPPLPAGFQAPPEKVCASVFTLHDAKDQPQQLRALCKNRVLFLGLVTTFEAIENQALKAELIDAHLGSERRIWLLTIQDDGQVLQEDLTGQIALTAGRGPRPMIDGIALDFSNFAQTGEVGIQARPEDRARAKADKIALADQIALERVRRAQRAPQN